MQQQVTRDLTFCIIENSTEDILIGKPELDELGYVSDKHSIELRALGLRFASVLPQHSEDAGASLHSEIPPCEADSTPSNI